MYYCCKCKYNDNQFYDCLCAFYVRVHTVISRNEMNKVDGVCLCVCARACLSAFVYLIFYFFLSLSVRLPPAVGHRECKNQGSIILLRNRFVKGSFFKARSGTNYSFSCFIYRQEFCRFNSYPFRLIQLHFPSLLKDKMTSARARERER